jgi:hypothetical protein
VRLKGSIFNSQYPSVRPSRSISRRIIMIMIADNCNTRVVHFRKESSEKIKSFPVTSIGNMTTTNALITAIVMKLRCSLQ